jgi:beta-glucosidase
MRSFRLVLLALLVSPIPLPASAPPAHPFQDPKLPARERAADLVARMSDEEKVRQMDMWQGDDFTTAGALDAEKTKAVLAGQGLGAVHYLFPSPALANAFQRLVMTDSRWGIPALVSEEMLHGYTARGSTSYPMPLALAGSFDAELVRAIGRAIATEARSQGVQLDFGPVLDVCSDPRYGRIDETFGEDPYLTATLGLAMIRGLQGEGWSDPLAVAAMPKHFIGHGKPSGGYHIAPVQMGERELRTEYLPPFAAAVREGGVLGIMSAYDEVDGVPMSENRRLLQGVLKTELGFQGFVQSDWGAITMLETGHRTAADATAAVAEAVSAGIDMQFYDYPHPVFARAMMAALASGAVSHTRLDDAGARILGVKFALGLFDRPFADETNPRGGQLQTDHRRLARQAARESVVLLQNRSGLLPLDRQRVRRLAVIGPDANRALLGGYSPETDRAVSLLEGLKQIAGPGVDIVWEKGCDVISKGSVLPAAMLFQPDGAQPGLKAEYFDNPALQGGPVRTRVEPLIDAHWRAGGLAEENVASDSFSVRWSGVLRPPAAFSGWIGAECDGGFRIWLDDQLVVEKWETRTPLFSAPVVLAAGRAYRLRVEYRHLFGPANLTLRLGQPETDFAPAVRLAKTADAVVLALGEDAETVGENKDRANPVLPGEQAGLAKALHAAGVPVILVLQNGRPLVFEDLAEQADAILEAWFCGEQAGPAIAEILFGDVNPSGRLAVSFSRTVGQFPISYRRPPTATSAYIDERATPAFSFGHGLSYTHFAYRDLHLEGPRTVVPDGRVRAAVTVTNTGRRAGDEVVLVFVRDLIASVTRPVRELKSFVRLSLAPGETKTVHIEIPIAALALWNQDMKQVVESGEFELWTGAEPEPASVVRFAVADTAP